MMIDVSMATVFSEVYLVYFLSFFSLFSGFPSSFVRYFFYFCLLILTKFLRTKSYVFGDVIVSCMTAGQPRFQGLSLPAPQRERDPGNEVDCRFGIQDGGLKFKMAGL